MTTILYIIIGLILLLGISIITLIITTIVYIVYRIIERNRDE